MHKFVGIKYVLEKSLREPEVIRGWEVIYSAA